MGRLSDAWKALTGKRPSMGSRQWLPGTGVPFVAFGSKYNYRQEAGDITRNSVFCVCRDWLVKNFYEPDWCVGKEETRDEWTAQKHHPLKKLLTNVQKTPDQRRKTTSRDVYGGAITDYLAYGNAYLFIAESGSRIPVALDWLPAKQMQVVTDSEGIAAYERWTPNGTKERYDPDEIVHVKYVPNPDYPFMGIGPVENQLRNVAAVNSGETTNGALLKWGTIGKLITPKISVEAIQRGEQVDEKAMKELTASMQRRMRGDMAGSIVETTLPVDVLEVGSSPDQLGIIELLDRPESFIVASMGLNVLALNLSSSAATRTFSNYAEGRQAAWIDGLVPLRGGFEDAFTTQLAVRWDESGGLKVWSEYKHCKAMQVDAEQRANVANVLFTSTLYTRNEALSAGGFEPVEGVEGGKYFGEPTEAQLEQQEAQAQMEQDNATDQADQSHEHDMELMRTERQLYPPSANGNGKR